MIFFVCLIHHQIHVSQKMKSFIPNRTVEIYQLHRLLTSVVNSDSEVTGWNTVIIVTQSIWAVLTSICSLLANWQALDFRFSLEKKCYVKLKKRCENLKLQLSVFYRHGCWPPSEWPVASATMTSKFMTPTSTSNRSSPVVLRWEPALLIACWHARSY